MTPGEQRYREAVDREQLIRLGAFVLPSESIGEFTVLPMTLAHHAILKAVRSPFVLLDRMPTIDDCAQLLWLLSPHYPHDLAEKRRIEKRCRHYAIPPEPRLHLPLLMRRWARKAAVRGPRFVELVHAIGEYLEDAFIDRPPSGGEPGPSYYSDSAYYADLCGERYGWSPELTVHVPLKALFQLLKIQRAKDAAKVGRPVIMFNPSDRYKFDAVD